MVCLENVYIEQFLLLCLRKFPHYLRNTTLKMEWFFIDSNSYLSLPATPCSCNLPARHTLIAAWTANLPTLSHAPSCCSFVTHPQAVHAFFLLGRLVFDTDKKNRNVKTTAVHECRVTETSRFLLADTLCLPATTHAFQCHSLSLQELWRVPGTVGRKKSNLRSQDLGSFKIPLKRGHVPKKSVSSSSILPNPIYRSELLHLTLTEYLASNILFLEDSFAWQFCRLYSTNLLTDSN